MRFARWVFLIAAIYGFAVLMPDYWLVGLIGRTSGPLTHPVYFYGFVGLALTWQAAFLLIARDPRRFRLFMPLAIIEKLVFPIPAWLLFEQGHGDPTLLPFASVDVIWLVLFAVAFVRAGRDRSAVSAPLGPALRSFRWLGDFGSGPTN